MATTAEQRLQRDIGANEISLPTADATELLAEAAETYPTGSAAALAYARVLAIRGMLASSSRLVTYRQNNSSENQSDVFGHLTKLLDFWQAETDKAAASGGGAQNVAGNVFTTAPGYRGR